MVQRHWAAALVGLRGAALCGLGFALGVGLAALGALLGPLAVIAAPAALAVVVLALSLPWIAIALVVACMPLGAASLPGVPLPLQAVEAAVLVAVVVVALGRMARSEAPLPWPRQLWWAAFLAGAAILATPGAIDPPAAFRQNAQLLGGLALALAVVGAVQRLVDLQRLVALILASGSVVCLAAALGVGELEERFGGAIVEGRATGIFPEPNQLGSLAAMMLALGCGVATGGRTRAVRLGGLASVGPSLAALILSLSRGAWIGTAFGLIALIALLPARRRLALIAAPLVVLSVAVAAFWPATPEVQVIRDRLSSFARPAANPYDGRADIWREAWREIQERPLTGQGPGGFGAASSRTDSLAQTTRAPHAHNVLLTVAAEAGLLAAALLVALTVAIASAAGQALRGLRARRLPEASLLVGVIAALVSVVGQGLVDYTLRNPVVFLLVWLLIGLILAAVRIAARTGETSGASGSARLGTRLPSPGPSAPRRAGLAGRRVG